MFVEQYEFVSHCRILRTCFICILHSGRMQLTSILGEKIKTPMETERIVFPLNWMNTRAGPLPNKQTEEDRDFTQFLFTFLPANAYSGAHFFQHGLGLRTAHAEVQRIAPIYAQAQFAVASVRVPAINRYCCGSQKLTIVLLWCIVQWPHKFHLQATNEPGIACGPKSVSSNTLSRLWFMGSR